MQETQETRILSLSREDPLEEELATRCSILAWTIPWTKEPGGYSPWGGQESDTIEHTCTHAHTHMRVREGQ